MMEPNKPMGEAPQADPAAGVKEAIVGVNTNMLKVKEAIAEVPQIPSELKGQLDNLIQQYQDFVQDMGAVANGGAPKAPPSEPPMRGPMPMTGGPGAKPAL